MKCSFSCACPAVHPHVRGDNSSILFNPIVWPQDVGPRIRRVHETSQQRPGIGSSVLSANSKFAGTLTPCDHGSAYTNQAADSTQMPNGFPRGWRSAFTNAPPRARLLSNRKVILISTWCFSKALAASRVTSICAWVLMATRSCARSPIRMSASPIDVVVSRSNPTHFGTPHITANISFRRPETERAGEF